MTKQVIVKNWYNPEKFLEFTVPDWLENFLICQICAHSNSFYCEHPSEDPIDHVHYFAKLMVYDLKEAQRVKKWLKGLWDANK